MIAPTPRVGGRDQGAGSSHDNTPCVVAPFAMTQVTNKDNRQRIEAGHNQPAIHESGGAAVAIDGLGVRMLTPLECERIMSWPDFWTKYGINEKNVTYELKDSPRYQLCGNGQAREWGEWFYTRLVSLENGIVP